MSELLKGNFKTKNKIDDVPERKEDLETKFEAAALKELGGSMTFVSKKKVKWSSD